MHSHFSEIFVQNCSSTMDLSLSFAQEQDFFLVHSNHQRHGQGSQNRSWNSLTGNLHFTLGMHKKKWNNIPIGLLSLYSGVILYQQIEKLLTTQGLSQRIECKWPNDILINNQKVSGILIKTSAQHYLIGIGINVHKSPTLTERPTISFKELNLNSPSNSNLMKEFYTSFKQKLHLTQPLLTEWIVQEWSLAHCWNKTIFIRNQKNISYTPISINNKGQLEVRNILGKKKWLTSSYLE